MTKTHADAAGEFEAADGEGGARPPASPKPMLALSGEHAAEFSPLRLDTFRRRGLVFADAVALCLSCLVVWATVPFDLSLSALTLLAALPAWIVLNKILGLYDRDASVINKSTLDELPRILHSVFLSSALIYLVWPLVPDFDLGRTQAIVFALTALVLNPSARTLARRALAHRLPPERCLVIGSGLVAEQVVAKLHAYENGSIEVVGYLDEPGQDPSSSSDQPGVVGNLAQLEPLCRALAVSRVIIAFPNCSDTDLLVTVDAAGKLGVKVSIVPRLFEAAGGAVEIDDLHGITLHGVRGFSRTRSSLGLKRTIDVTVASVALLLMAPALVMVAIAVKLTSPGPVLFVQRRIGRGDQPFAMFKFRTMYSGADRLKRSLEHLNEVSHPMFKMADDPRVTSVGRLLRRYSIDELPQLINVLKGEMSLVGPRPLVPAEADAVIGRHRARLQLTPGLTGPWQVMGRTAIPFDEMVELDYRYVAGWSLWNDFKLMLCTLPVLMRGDGQ